jgi:hypothetical protein
MGAALVAATQTIYMGTNITKSVVGGCAPPSP